MNRPKRALALLAVALSGCATLPTPKHEKAEFPKEKAFIETVPTREFERMGEVKSKVNYDTLGIESEDDKTLCQNYFNKAVNKLVDYAKKKGGDAVIEVRSVVFMVDGKVELHSKAECYDDGAEGQVLARGTVIKYKPPEDPIAKKKKKP